MTKKKATAITLSTLGLGEDFVPISAEDTLDMDYSRRTGLVTGYTEEQFKQTANELRATASALKDLQAQRAKEMLDSGDTTKYQVLSLDEQGKKDSVAAIVARVELINRAISEARDGYMSLLPDLGKLRQSFGDTKTIEFAGVKYRNGFKGFCMSRFGFSKSTYYNLIKILDYFYDSVTGQLAPGVAEKGLRPTLAVIAALEGKDKKQSEKSEQAEQAEQGEQGEQGEQAEQSEQPEQEQPKDTKVQKFFESITDLLDYLATPEAAEMGIRLDGEDENITSEAGVRYALVAYIPTDTTD